MHGSVVYCHNMLLDEFGDNFENTSYSVKRDCSKQWYLKLVLHTQRLLRLNLNRFLWFTPEMNIFTSHVSNWGDRIGPVFALVCLSARLSALIDLIYGPKIWFEDVPWRQKTSQCHMTSLNYISEANGPWNVRHGRCINAGAFSLII